MCGIAGVIGRERLEEAALGRMRDALAHRGPDDAGLWIDHDAGVGLAHRRLAIIDLSPAAHQPMSNEDGSIWAVYNGEVYNYRELKERLEGLGHDFRSASDTETVIHAYEEWGPGCLDLLRGMFAFALWDGRRRRLLLARDHTGIKPLFYYWDGTTFAFASEIKALWEVGGLDRTIDRSAVFDYLTYLYVPAPKTAYRRVRALRPGHVLTFEGHAPTISCYWDVPLEQDRALDERRAVALVEERLAEAVTLNLVSDVPVGVFLSGGLDSSTVVAHMAGRGPAPLHSFSIGFDVAAHSETPYARIVARAFATEHHERIVGRTAVRDLLPRIVSLYDEPYADGSAMPTLRVAELAREQVKVVLSGDGGDEVFAGYNWYERWLRLQELGRHWPGLVRREVLGRVGHLWPRTARGASVKHLLECLAEEPLAQYARQIELFSPGEKRDIMGPEWAAEFADYDDYWYFREFWREDLDPITRLQYLDLKTYLPDDILTKVDRATMAVSLEARPPLLDHRLIEALFRIPAEVRFRNGEKKHLLRRAVAQLLPPAILAREKKGFSSPLMQWMADERPWVRRYLDAPSPFVRRGAADALGRLNRGPKCWALLVLEAWRRAEGG